MPRLVNRVLRLDTVSLYSSFSGNWYASLKLRLTDSGNWVSEVVEAVGAPHEVVRLVEIDPSLRSDLVVEEDRQSAGSAKTPGFQERVPDRGCSSCCGL